MGSYSSSKHLILKYCVAAKNTKPAFLKLANFIKSQLIFFCIYFPFIKQIRE